MGVVYRATQLGLDRPVALKVIAAELANNAGLPRTASSPRRSSPPRSTTRTSCPSTRPARPTASSTSPCATSRAPTCARSSTREGGLAPERAVRHRLAGRRGARRRAPPRPRAPRRQAAQRPDRRSEGEEHAYLTDFGLTKHAAAAGGITRTGQFVGTPDFVAPEQIRGEAADARADVYALGCVLFHALTGRTPFPRDSELAKMYAHLNDPAPAARRSRRACPPALDAVIATAMAKEPDERYASAGDLARAAWAALAGRGRAAAAAGQRRHRRGRARRRRRARPTRRRRARRRVRRADAAPARPATATAPASARPPAAAAAPKSAGPAGWPRRRRMALLVALPGLLAGRRARVAALAAAGLLERRRATAPATQRRRDGAAERRHDRGADAARGRRPRSSRRSPSATAPTASPSTATRSSSPTRADGTLDADRRRRPTQLVGEPVDGRRRTPTGSPPARASSGWSTPRATELQRLETEPDARRGRPTMPVGKDAAGRLARPAARRGSPTPATTRCSASTARSATTVGDPIGVGDQPIGIFVGSKVWVTNFGDDTLTQDRHRHRAGRGRADRGRRPAARRDRGPGRRLGLEHARTTR